ncbi:MAG: hypothetical protein LBB60_04560 [Desulfovibrio sp.]|jgi:hypothetical protein|nr:hypothetical protein [Desulfovibrio sp.]
MRKMRRLWAWLTCSALALTVFMPTAALAAAKRADVVIVADTRQLDGLMRLWAEMYNESHLTFAIMTMLIIPVMGCVLGVIADFFMSKIGINLKSRELAEH